VRDAEVLQKMLHRYSAIDRREAIAPAMQVLLALVDGVFPMEGEDVLRAAQIVSGKKRRSTRDALHIGVMARYGVVPIFSFDADYDRWPGLERISAPYRLPQSFPNRRSQSRAAAGLEQGIHPNNN
jgi:predicted nucleic acid-binding protein